MKYPETYLSIRDKRMIRKWVKALRSGNYIQTRGNLWNNDRTEHCCLGVLCEIGGAEPMFNEDGWVKSCPKENSLLNKKFSDGEGLIRLWTKNDMAGWSFEQIADKLQEALDNGLENTELGGI